MIMGQGARRRHLTVEECLCLSAVTLRQDGVFRAIRGSRWVLPFSASFRPEFAVIEYPGAVMALRFDNSTFDRQWIPVTTTKPHLGGRRYWLKCPMVRSGVACGRRVGRLYLPPGCLSFGFGCRTCYDLTYESVQKHDKRIDRLRRNPLSLQAALLSKRHSQRLLGLKALSRRSVITNELRD